MTVRILLDRQCPGCNWPEVIAVGESIEAGPENVECGRWTKPCGYTAKVQDGSPLRPRKAVG